MKTLIPGVPGRLSSIASSPTFSFVRAHKKPKVAPGSARRAPDLVLQRISAEVVVGDVFGISKIEVTPPCKAALVPLSRSSLCSSPGSRK